MEKVEKRKNREFRRDRRKMKIRELKAKNRRDDRILGRSGK